MAVIDTILSQIINAKYGREVRQAIHDGIQQCYADAIVGIKGDQGTSITSVTRTSGNGAEGTVDVYTVAFSNNTSSTFQVRHGSKGSTGLTGDKGDKGDKGDTITSIIRTAGNGAEGTVDTYTITMSSGDTSTFQVRNGSKGSTGDTGPKGDKGEQGVSITNIVRTSGTGAEGTTDVYTITLSNGVQSTFNVRNGSKGNQGIQGPIGNTGLTGPKGDPGVSITNIVRTSGTGEEGTTDIYTIYLSSGASQTFTVKHGSRGPIGATGVGIRDVRKISGTGAEGTVDTYAVMLSDGENKNFDVRHGSKGSTGSKGDPGKGVVGINKVSGTGAPGTVDTYAISYTDGTVTNFNVYNGADGAGSPTAQKLANARALTIGAVSKLFDGSEDVTWSLEELDLAQRLHTHTTSQITDFPTEMPASDVYEWAKTQTKPTYTPTEVGAASEFHQHTTSDITNFPSSMPASDVESWAKALTKPSYTPEEVGAAPVLHNHTTGSITDFPETMPPSPHNHSTSDITDFPTEMPPEAHDHGNITSDGKIGTTPDLILGTGTDGQIVTKTPTEVGAAEAIHNHPIADLTNLIVGGVNHFGQATQVVPITGAPTITRNHAEAPNGFYCLLNAATTDSVRIKDVIDSNGFWTVSFDLQHLYVGSRSFTLDACDNDAQSVTAVGDGVWERKSVTINVTSYTADNPNKNSVNVRGISTSAHLYFRNIKIEKGTVVTDWSPHLADIQLGQNILHNWDFTNPINQRGQSEYAGVMNGYSIDRWYVSAGAGAKVNVESNSILLTSSSGGLAFSQNIESPAKFNGRELTLSLEVAEATSGVFKLCITDSLGTSESIIYPNQTITVKRTISNVSSLRATIIGYGAATARIKRIKLEIGPHSTLRLDPPMDWAVELPKCQRFFRKISTGWIKPYTVASNSIAFFIPTGVNMREGGTPTIASIDGVVSNISWQIQSGFAFSSNGLEGQPASYITSAIASKTGHGLTLDGCFARFVFSLSRDL